MEPIESEIAEKFENAQQKLIDDFKLKMKKISSDVLHELYTDVANYAATGAHVNYYNYLRDEFKKSMTKEIVSEGNGWSWAHSMRMEILKNHKEELQNKIISDLQDRVESLNVSLEGMRSRW